MRYRGILPIAATMVLVAEAMAQDTLERGDVIVNSPHMAVFSLPSQEFTVLDGDGHFKRLVTTWNDDGPNNPPGPLRHTYYGLSAAAPDRILTSGWDRIIVTADLETIAEMYTVPGPEILGEILPLRSGDFLVFQLTLPMHLLKFSASGVLLSTFELPPFSNTQYWEWSARADVLSDQCTVVYHGLPERDPGADSRRIRTFNICTNRPGDDLFVVPPGAKCVSSIRQIPGGDFLVGVCNAVHRFDRSGNLVATYPVAGDLLALTPDGSGFWTTIYEQPGMLQNLYRIELASPDRVALYTTTWSPNEATALTVVGEWRAALQPARRRAVR